jgi:hypothetical protein
MSVPRHTNSNFRTSSPFNSKTATPFRSEPMMHTSALYNNPLDFRHTANPFEAPRTSSGFGMESRRTANPFENPRTSSGFGMDSRGYSPFHHTSSTFDPSFGPRKTSSGFSSSLPRTSSAFHQACDPMRTSSGFHSYPKTSSGFCSQPSFDNNYKTHSMFNSIPEPMYTRTASNFDFPY